MLFWYCLTSYFGLKRNVLSNTFFSKHSLFFQLPLLGMPYCCMIWFEYQLHYDLTLYELKISTATLENNSRNISMKLSIMHCLKVLKSKNDFTEITPIKKSCYNFYWQEFKVHLIKFTTALPHDPKKERKENFNLIILQANCSSRYLLSDKNDL